MNVDEGMKLLRDPQVWDVELAPRAGAFAKPRPWRFAGAAIAVSAVAAVITAAVVVGSLQPPHVAAPVGTSSPTATEPPPTATPTPTPRPVEPTGLSAPTPVFGGDCSSFASDADMAAIAGGDISSDADPSNAGGGGSDAQANIHAQLGVMACGWVGDDGSIQLTVLRNEAAPIERDHTCTSYTWGEASMNRDLCVVDVVASGIRVTGSINWPNRSESRAIAKRLVAYLDDADFGDAAIAPAAGAGAWFPQIQCANLSPIEIDGRPVDLTLDILGSDAGSLPVEDQLTQLYSPTGCYGDGLSFAAFSDGAWLLDEALKGLKHDGVRYEAVDVVGFDTAVRSTHDDSRDYYLISGTNYLQVRVGTDVEDADVIASILAKLEAGA
jgi:hypothetical protein